MKRNWPRVRRATMRFGLAACVTVFVLWLSSMIWFWGWHGRDRSLLLSAGFARYHWIHRRDRQQRGWHAELNSDSWSEHLKYLAPSVWVGPESGIIHVPLWLPLTAFLFPSFALWWMERRGTRAGHCRVCGYCLHGLTRQRCPECGEPFDASELGGAPSAPD